MKTTRVGVDRPVNPEFRTIPVRRGDALVETVFPTVEARFISNFREPTTDAPGLVLTESGAVYLVNEDGTRTQLPGGGSIPIPISDLEGYPGSSSVFLRGDGVWADGGSLPTGWLQDDSDPANVFTNGGYLQIGGDTSLELVTLQTVGIYLQASDGSQVFLANSEAGLFQFGRDGLTSFQIDRHGQTTLGAIDADALASLLIKPTGEGIDQFALVVCQDGNRVVVIDASGSVGVTTSDSIAFAASGDLGALVALDAGGLLVSNVRDPVSDQDAATKAWVLANSSLPSWFMSGTSDPYGVVTPSQTGALFQDTAFGILYVALGPDSDDWYSIAGPSADGATGVYSDSTGAIKIKATTGRAVVISDVEALTGTGNGLVWSSGGGDGGQRVTLTLGSSGQFEHVWDADGSYTAPGSVNVIPVSYSSPGDVFVVTTSTGQNLFQCYTDAADKGSVFASPSGNDRYFDVSNGGLPLFKTGRDSGGDAVVGFYGVTPVVQQDATDGASLVAALVDYGFLASGSLWTASLPTWFQSGSGSPVGLLNPSQKGALYQDTQNGGLYEAIGVSNSDWAQLGGNCAVVPGPGVNYDGDTIMLITNDGAAKITDIGALAGTQNYMGWVPQGPDGNQIVIFQLGGTGQFTHTWAADGSYTTPGAVSIVPSTDSGDALSIRTDSLSTHLAIVVSDGSGNQLTVSPAGHAVFKPSDSSTYGVQVLPPDRDGFPYFDVNTPDSTGSVFRIGPSGSNDLIEIGISTSLVGFFGKSPAVQHAAVTAPTGGGVQDAEARTAIGTIISLLQSYGLSA